MERRKIIAAIVEIANELDNIGMYEEANQLTKVAQAAGQQFMQGLRDMGRGVQRGLSGAARDTANALNSGLQTARQGLSDVGEVVGGNMANKGFNAVNPAVELGLNAGGSGMSDNQIAADIEIIKDYLARGDQKRANDEAYKIEGNIMKKIKNIQAMPFGQSQAGKDAITKLMQQQFQVRQVVKTLPKGTAIPATNRANAGQMGTSNAEMQNFITKARQSGAKTKADIYNMALQQKGPNFANNVAADLQSNGYGGRNDVVKSR
jgi:hypothetical protein